MDKKLALQDIVDLLAKKTSLNKKEADTFFREFFAVIIDTVFSGEPVKIKDFGTFKLITVDSRETVDVNTGARIVIPAHSKISFLPDKSLKALVNKPFAHFDITPLEEGVTFTNVEVSNEPAEIPEEDTAIDEPEFVNQLINKVQPEAKKPVEAPKPEIPKPETPAASAPQSFVYTYTTPDTATEKDGAPITLVVPADKVANESPEPASLPEVPIEPQTEEKDTSLEINKVQAKLGQLKGAIEALSKVKSSTPEPLATVAEKEAAEPEALEPTAPVAVVEPTMGQEPPVEEPSIVLPNRDKVVFNPIRETHDEYQEDEADDNSLGNSLDNDFDAEPAPEYQDDALDYEPVDYGEYPDYYQQTGWTAIRRRLPIILFLVAIIGACAYLVISIIENNNQIGKPREIPITATKDTDDADVSSEDDSLTIADNTVIDADVDDLPVTPPPIEAIEDEPEDDADEVADLPEEGGVLISENLKIAVPDKAAYIKNNRQIDGTPAAQPAPATVAPPVEPAPSGGNTSTLVVTIKPGASLLQLAREHYKNQVFWVYIYKENEDKIGRDYDNISAGDRIAIPAPKKYGIDPNSQASIEKARSLEREIHASRSRSRR
ncbi:MAG: HU family DNA-binding protein [Prevotella sp.]|jgi:nucleoid DNA-binding protein|nr:HU family DNA-binding protein [Prevotella sp.]